MRRRELMLVVSGAMMTARALRAQQEAMPVIGLLYFGSAGPGEPFVTAFRQGLSEEPGTERRCADEGQSERPRTDGRRPASADDAGKTDTD